MSREAPSVTVVIAARPEQQEILARAAAQKLDYPTDRLEILVARGAQPSAQRNQAARQARGDLIYFLDDDSIPDPANLRRAAAHFEEPAVVMVGGPNLCPADVPPIERAFALVMASWIAFGPSRARYAQFGRVRSTTEKELILCNLMARKDALLKAGGFDEALYPNEENALMDELVQRGGVLLHDPDFLVLRRPRRTVDAFARMLLNYGRGRAEQFRLHPTLGSMLNFAPPLFVVALAAAPLAPVAAGWGLAGYALALAIQALWSGSGVGPLLCRVVPLLALTHIAYGLGFWRGLFTRLRPASSRAPVAVVVERVAHS